MDLVTEACLKLATDCRTNGTRGRLGVRIKSLLQLPLLLSPVYCCLHETG